MNPLTEQLVAHDLDDTRALLEAAKQLSDEDYRSPHLPGNTVLGWDGPTSPSHTSSPNWSSPRRSGSRPSRTTTSRRSARTTSARCSTGTTRRPRAGSRQCGTSTAEAHGTTGSSTPSATRPRARHEQHSRARAHVLGTPSSAGPPLLRASGQKVDSGDPINWLRARHGEARRWRSCDPYDVLHRDDARRLPCRRAD